MSTNIYDKKDSKPSWCPGCGNFAALKILKQALVELKIDPTKMVLCSGIGQAAKLPHYMQCNMFNGLHGRYLSNATAIKTSNPNLTVVAFSGDGCTYSEGGNHFIHTIRYNPWITNIVSNNFVYGLTKGQASPTSALNFIDSKGIATVNEPFNPLSVAIALGASFVARAFVGDALQTKKIMVDALSHHGYALIDLLSPCVSFNHIQTYQWFKDHTYYLEDSYIPNDPAEAFKRAIETKKLPLGIFLVNKNKPTYEETLSVYREDKTPLYQRTIKRNDLDSLIRSFR